MARGKSGRIVIEIDPTKKDELYKALAMEGLTLKEWFLRRVEILLGDIRQPNLFGNLNKEEYRLPKVAEMKAEYESNKMSDSKKNKR